MPPTHGGQIRPDKVWISENGAVTPLRELPGPHLINILHKCRADAEQKIQNASTPVPNSTSWVDFVPIIYQHLAAEALRRGLRFR